MLNLTLEFEDLESHLSEVRTNGAASNTREYYYYLTKSGGRICTLSAYI